MDFAPGTRFGVYEVRTLIGVGGMGEVYCARDTRLDRDVAIKVLPRSLTGHEDRLARFEREARTLATLNHPNIATIYGFEEADGVRAIVMELVDGETLANKLQRSGRLGISEALAIARQIADALDAAHEKGIVHRDLKPANLKVSAAGIVKVLDFGLAKASAEESVVNLTNSPTVMGTSLGVILGTAPYMSPEQARGHAVDKRTDIWAFGCVLFEMLTGTPAFQRSTVPDTIAAILERDPDWTALPASTPAAVTSLLHRCLEKDPRLRLRDIGDVRHLLDQPDRKTIAHNRQSPASVKWGLVSVAVVALGLLGAAWLRNSGTATIANPLANAVFTRLTDFPGTENDASISRDGKWVAFRSDRDGPEDTWVSQVGTGQFLNLTHGTQNHVLVRNQGFTADGSEVWLSGVIGGTRLREMPLTGGTPKPLLTEHAMNPSWSPDGSKVAFHTYDPGDPIFVGDAVGAELPQVYKLSPGAHNHYLTWSPDSQWIYFVSGVWDARAMDIWRMAPSGKPVERLTQDNRDITHLSVLNDRMLVYVAPDDRGEGPWLWAFDTQSRSNRRISSGLERYTSVDASADGRRLVVSVSNPTANLWTMPVSAQPITEKDVTQLTVPSARALAPRYGGRNLFYLSARGGGDGLWRYVDGQVAEIWKGSDGALLEPPAVSFDGHRIAIVVRKLGKSSLMTLSSEGGDLQALAPSIVVSSTPSWSPDGQWIVASGSENSVPGLFKIPVGGGDPTRLLQGVTSNPVWSPDGSVIVYTGPVVGITGPVLMIRPDGSALPPPSISVKVLGQRYRFVPGHEQLVYIRGSQSVMETFWLLDLDTGKSRELTAFDARDTRTFDITPDGKQIVFDRLRENSDIVLIDLPNPK